MADDRLRELGLLVTEARHALDQAIRRADELAQRQPDRFGLDDLAEELMELSMRLNPGLIYKRAELRRRIEAAMMAADVKRS